MFERQLGLRENPFLSGHQPKYVYPSREHQEALAHLRYGIQNGEPFVLITGEVGTGKTTAVYDALAEWGPRAVVALITNSALTRNELLEEICLRFGLATPTPMSKPQTLVQLERLLGAVRARGELAILLLDEAQNLERDLLEEIRLLSNLEVQGEKLIQIFLVGQPELELKLAQPELRQLRQRIGIHYRISPLSATETAHYIHHRVAVAGGNANELFPAETCVEIFRVTNGIPREINIVAGQSLLNAFVEDSRIVTSEHVKAVEREIEFQSVLQRNEAVAAPAPPAPALSLVPRSAPAATRPPVEAPALTRAPSEVVTPATIAASMAPAASASAVEPAPSPAYREPAVSAPTVDHEPVAEPSRTTPPLRTEEEPRILPSWFDEVMARQKAAAAAPSAPAIQPPPPPPPAPPIAVEPPRRPAHSVPVESPRAPAYSMPAEPTRPPEIPVATVVPPIERPEYRQLASPPRHRTEPEMADAAARESESNEATGVTREAASEYISPRLRAKLNADQEETPRSRSATGWLAAATAIAAMAIAIVLVMRFGPWGKKPGSSTTPSGEPAGSTSAVTPQASPQPAPAAATPSAPANGAAQPAQSSKIANSTSVPVPKAPATRSVVAAGTVRAPDRASAPASAAPSTRKLSPTREPARAAAPSTQAALSPPRLAETAASPKPSAPATAARTSPATNRFGIAVGTYLNEDRANSERTSLGESTQLPTRVLTATEDGGEVYRVVMGSFESRVEAERAASDLIRRGLVNEARVVPLARATPSQ